MILTFDMSEKTMHPSQARDGGVPWAGRVDNGLVGGDAQDTDGQTTSITEDCRGRVLVDVRCGTILPSAALCG